jgi:hypothetical protein
MNQSDEAMAPQHSSTTKLEAGGIAVLAFGLGMLLLGASALGVVLLVLSACLVSIGRVRARGWSGDRLGATVAILVGAVLLADLGWAIGRLVGVLLVGSGAWFAWHLSVGPRVRKL